jgi:hypothetical protein
MPGSRFRPVAEPLSQELDPALARLDIRAYHRRDRRSKSKLAKGRQNIQIAVEAAPAQRRPRDFSGSILSGKHLSFILGHGSTLSGAL